MKTLISLLCTAAISATAVAQQMPEPNPPTEVRTARTLQPLTSHITLTTTAPTKEWLLHKTLNGSHPSNREQRMMWLMNKARRNPRAEGLFLANIKAANVRSAIDYFNVDLAKLKTEFDTYSAKPPAAFDRRLYNAALAHSNDLIARNSQDHDNQFERVNNAGFSYSTIRGNVFSYAKDPLYAHAGFNIDWGFEADGMQTGRGHRSAIMSQGDGAVLTNVGIAMVADNNPDTDVGPWVVTGNYANALTSAANHFNRFIVGTVWKDKNKNGMYDVGEGLADVKVKPNIGTYWATTAKSGGYALPATATGVYTVTFSGGGLGTVQKQLSVTVNTDSVLLDVKLLP
jgi:uncharacterized protein YkwD